MPRNAAHPFGPSSDLKAGGMSGLYRAATKREQPARTLLDEQDDEDQHGDLAQHRAGEGLEEFVDDTERHGADQRTEQVADAAEHHDHETVDDIDGAKIGA